MFSTSSPLASVALFSDTGALLATHSELAGRNAGAVILSGLMELLEGLDKSAPDIELFVADVGPGSFTGVRVGVILAKTLAYAQGKTCGGVSSFDLISPCKTVAIGAKKGSYFVRHPGQPALSHQDEWPKGAFGYAADRNEANYPLAEHAGPLLGQVMPLTPFELLPEYIAEPNISLPKRPYGQGVAHP